MFFMILAAWGNDMDVDCSTPLNQSEMLYCATRQFERSEAMMINLYKSVAAISDAAGKKKLSNAQLSFESYRTSNCLWQGDKYRKKETKAQTEAMECQTELTNNRIDELQNWLLEMN